MDIEAILLDHSPWRRGAGVAWSLPPVRRPRQRDILDHVLLRAPHDRAIVVMGPRQVGKTVLLRQLAADLLERGWPADRLVHFDFSDDRLVEPVSPRDIVTLAAGHAGSDEQHIFLLDEIGHTGDFGPWLKQAIDATPHRVVATDSSATLLRAGARESGPGRWDEWELETLSYSEFLALRGIAPEDERDAVPDALESYLQRGGFPEHANAAGVTDARAAIRVDIAERALLRDLMRFGIDVLQAQRLFVFLAQQPGAVLNISHRARDLDAKRESVRKWLHHLGDTRLIYELPRSTVSAAKRLRAAPKVYPADPALVTAFAVHPDPLTDERIRAAVFETAVFRHLRDSAAWRSGDLGYAAGRDGEIDFVAHRGSRSVAIEVTCAPTAREDKLTRLRDRAEARGIADRYLIYGGRDGRSRAGVHVLPLRDFLRDPEVVLR